MTTNWFAHNGVYVIVIGVLLVAITIMVWTLVT